MRVPWVASVAAAVVVALASVGSSTAAAEPRVTVIGDSVLTAVEWNHTPLSIFERGLNLQLEIGVCRTIEDVSCPFEGGTVPTMLDVVSTLGPQLGETVLVEVGYNDPPDEFAARVEDAVDALLAAGVHRILWANLREWQQQYVGMNETLAAAAARHPQLTIIDWEGYSHDHYSWFQGDGIHLVYNGAVAMARLFNGSIKEALSPPVIRSTGLPVARVGKPYAVRLTATGGEGPYTWRVTSGPLPAGLHLLASGRLIGTPRKAGSLSVTLQAADSRGVTTATRKTLRIERRFARLPDDN